VPPRDFINIAHRGASAYTPENTFAAFDKALALGVDNVEFDVHFSADGHIVVIHDETLDRTTSGTGPVVNQTMDRLRSLDAGGWFSDEFKGEPIPTLAHLLERYKGWLHFHIEVKGRTPGLAKRTADLVRGFGVGSVTTITSFDLAPLEEVRTYAPELFAGWLVREIDDSVIAQAQELKLVQLCPPASQVTPELVNDLHEKGFVVRAWRVGDTGLMRQVVDSGADGMTVNFPDKLDEYLSAE
jgi:glycerophosphoryl diester phosphodiesterase